MVKVAGTDLSENDILREYDARIRAMARRFSGADDDLLQEGRFAFLRALRRFRKNRENTATLWSYAYAVVLGTMLNAVRKRKDEAAVLESFDVAESGCVGADDVAELHERMSLLDDEEQAVVRAHVAGHDIRSIAAARGKTRFTTHKTLTTALETIREYV